MTRYCFYVDETMKSPHGYIPSVVHEGEPGHSPMIGQGEHAQPWYWGDDIDTAKRLAAEANEELGLSPEDVKTILASSIGEQIRLDAARDRRQERYERAKAGKPLDVTEL